MSERDHEDPPDAEFTLGLWGLTPDEADEVFDAVFELLVGRCGCEDESTPCRFTWSWGGRLSKDTEVQP